MNAVVKTDQTQALQVNNDVTPMLAMIERAARDPNVDVEKMERLMQMQERVLARDAEQQFNTAMMRAQSQIGRIAADRENKQTHSWYATYAALDRVVRPIYTDAGFSLSFNTEPPTTPDSIHVVCLASHCSGHTRKYGVDMPADGKGAKGGDVMTKTHAAGSAMSYGQRHLLKLIFNIAIGVDPDDDDGNGASAGATDPAWFNKVQAMHDKPSRDAVKAEMVKQWGAATKIPKDLMRAYNERIDELRKVSK